MTRHDSTPAEPPAGNPTAADPADLARPRPAAGTGGTRARTPGRLTKRQLLVGCAVIAFALHTLAVLFTWFTWREVPGARGWWVVITDMPVSFLYAHFTHELLLLWSLTLGGLQWACTGALLAWVIQYVGTTRRRRRRT